MKSSSDLPPEDSTVAAQPARAERGPTAPVSTGNVIIRAATAADVPAIVEMAIALGRQHQTYDAARFALEAFGTTPLDLERAYQELVQQALGEPHAILRVGAREGEVVGYVFGRIEEANFFGLCPRAGWIHDIFVRPSARGERLGGRLLDGIVVALRDLGAAEIMLSVSPMNDAARALFETRGFGVTMLECRLGAGGGGSRGVKTS